MAAFTEEHRTLTRKLIKTITGFEPSDENFKLCFQFAKQNFRFHRYLDVNELKVQRSIDGLKEKFRVHSQPSKASALEKLTTSFINLHLAESYPRSAAHYGILLFLLEVSNSPVNTDYVPLPDSPTEAAPVDDFDWTAYLMEGIHYEPIDSGSLSEWSDSSSETGSSSPAVVSSGDSAVGEELIDPGESPPTSDSHATLLSTIHVPYWDIQNPEHQSDLSKLQASCCEPSAHPACSLAARWSEYALSMAPLVSAPDPLVTLSEGQVVRETIWALLGIDSSFVYKISKTEVTARRDIQVPHLTPLALHKQLEFFCEFVFKFRGIRSCYIEHTVPGCRTYEAFTSALRVYVNRLEEPIRAKEREAISKKSLVTMMSLEFGLKEVWLEVQQLYSLVDTVWESLPPHPTPFAFTSSLLATLWQSLQLVDSLGPTGLSCRSTIISLWLATIRPYFIQIESWIQEGSLLKHHEEFFIKHEANNGGRSWGSEFTLKHPIPDFLQPIAKQVLQAGKSMYIIDSIGKSKEMEVGDSPRSLYEEFLAALKCNLPSNSGDKSLDNDGEQTEDIYLSRLDPLGKKYIKRIVPIEINSETLITQSPDTQLWDCVSSGDFSSVCLPLSLQQSITELVSQRCHTSSGLLVKLLTREYQLADHFKTVQRFFLMADGPVMHHFTADIFQRIQDGGDWQSSSFLNSTLREALQSQYADSADLEQRIEVVCTDIPGQTPVISLHYTVSWPLDMVFSQDIMSTYNKVFQFLLMVNRARWSLETVHLRQSEMARLSPQLQGRARLLLLLRARLLHFVNNLINYLMTRILHSVGVEFEANVRKAVDMDTVLKLHKDYTNTLADRCLLNKKAGFVKEAVNKVLNLAITFKHYWEKGLDNFSTEHAQRIEDDFSKCCHFLVSCLNNTIKRGSFPHLESLAFSMQTLKTGQKIFPI